MEEELGGQLHTQHPQLLQFLLRGGEGRGGEGRGEEGGEEGGGGIGNFKHEEHSV